MLSLSNSDVSEALKRFKSKNVEVCFLVPSETGMTKSIMDATRHVREFFRDKEVHDYDLQRSGEEAKVSIETLLLSGQQVIETKTSLYRPKTKKGDPRIWIYKLKDHAKSGDLLAISVKDSKLVVVNCSQSDLSSLLNEEGEFSLYFKVDKKELTESATELFSMLNEISNRGFITTLRAGDTGVGYTLETLLNIPANSSRAPDYKGIEIKSGRKRSTKRGRTTIFSQVPNWNLSRVKEKSKGLLYLRGRYNEKKGRLQLFHELSTLKTNSYDMMLEIDRENNLLHQVYVDGELVTRDVTWEFSLLEERLREKHRETFWVYADSRGKSGDKDEQFHYKALKHTGSVDISAFRVLIESGQITLDYTIKEVKKGVAKDQGYLFKIHSKNLNLLFNRVEEYQLGSGL